MDATAPVDSWLLENLACPRHQCALHADDGALTCPDGCSYPVVNGVPVMLVDDASPTIGLVAASIKLSRSADTGDILCLESLGVSDHERRQIEALAAAQGSGIDPVVSWLVGATNGIAYKHLIGKLNEYPIPEIRLAPGAGTVFVDIGCSWGRWSIAASRKGYRVVGIDPSLGAVLAARRAAQKLGSSALFVVGDARYLPFKDGFADQTFSYSVLQHFSRPDAAAAAQEMGRVLRPGGSSLVQMPSKFGVRCLYTQARRFFREGEGFEVRYWTISALRRTFGEKIGRTVISVDCFFGLGLQYTDRKLFRWPLRLLTEGSELLRRLSQSLPVIAYSADSVYVTSTKGDRSGR